MPVTVHRVVAAEGADGRSAFVSEGPAPHVVAQPGRGLVFHELWATDGVGRERADEDAGARRPAHHPPPGGTLLRIVEFLPDEQRDGAVTADLEAIGAEQIAVANADPTFHRNETVDYNVVISGEIYAVTETEEVLLRPGDVLIQRGTSHTWSNRSGRPCVYASVMVSAMAR